MFDIWHIGIPVKNLTATLKFYTEVLDFELLGTFEGTMGFVRPPGKAFTLEFMETPVEDPKFNQSKTASSGV